MSAKWQRVKRWDDEHLTGPLRPLWVLMRLLSSVWLAIIVLVLIAFYAVLASVPIGMLALAPTWAFYAMTVVIAVAVGAFVPAFVVRTLLNKAGRGVRFAVPLFVAIGCAIPAVWLWHRFAWPAIHYDPVTGHGVRFFESFCRAYEATTLRRLPGFEMTELEFYSWWPMRVLLVVFVVNMITATVRRIAFTFNNLGVLTVHTGIVLIAVGSLYYQRLKQEGDTILFAPTAMPGSTPHGAGARGVGPAQPYFYDNTAVVIYASQRLAWNGAPMWEQRPIAHLPRYNDYDLSALHDARTGDARTLRQRLGSALPWDRDAQRPLDITLPAGPGAFVDPDIQLRVVGYAAYAEPIEDIIPLPEPADPANANPLRVLELILTESGTDDPAFRFTLFPREPARRVSENSLIGIEHTVAMPAERWDALSATLPEGTEHALIIEVPREGGEPYRAVLPATPGEKYELGQTGFSLGVKQLAPEPPFPIVTEGYRGARSSVAIVEITGPMGEPADDGSRATETVDRWVYHRFNEINQELLSGPALADGRPARRDPSDAIRVRYIDASKLQVYLDDAADGHRRALVRSPGTARPRVIDSMPDGQIESIIPGANLRIAQAWPNAERVDIPAPVPAASQQRDQIGTHANAMVAVEVRVPRPNAEPWRRVVWLPFSKYMGAGLATEKMIEVPGGRTLRLAFGRRQHQFGGFTVAMVDFEMIAYDHRGAPRDYQSIVRVAPRTDLDAVPDFDPYQHTVKLNAPLRAPFHWDDDRPIVANVFGRIVSGLSPAQFKLSQAGWDQQGWTESQAQADAGLTDKPRARFTILGVGNNPGIHVIALGGVLVALGTPWAFYVKPWLVKRQKQRLAAEHRERTAKQVAHATQSEPKLTGRDSANPEPAGSTA